MINIDVGSFPNILELYYLIIIFIIDELYGFTKISRGKLTGDKFPLGPRGHLATPRVIVT